jgi:hypothetical protein
LLLVTTLVSSSTAVLGIKSSLLIIILPFCCEWKYC